MLPLLLFLGTAALSVQTQPADAEVVASRFVQALGAEEMNALAALGTREATATRDWQILRAALETYVCISIHSHQVEVVEASETEMTLVVTVHATALARGTPRTPLPFPRRWHLDVTRTADGWKLRNVLAGERFLARRLAAIPELREEDIETCVAEGVDPELLLIVLADEHVLRGHTKATYRALEMERAVARRLGLPLAEVYAIRGAVVGILSESQPRAAALATEARRVADAADHADARAASLLMSGTVWWGADAIEALQHYQNAAILMDAVNDPRPSMKALFMRGSLLAHRGSLRDVPASNATLTRAAERFDWTEGRCISAMQGATLFDELQDAAPTNHYTDEAVRCAERWGDRGFRMMAISGKATAEEKVGNHEEAARLRRKVLDEASAGDVDSSVIAVSQMSLAQSLADSGRYEEAEAQLRQVAVTLRGTSEMMLEAKALADLARIQMRHGRLAEALRTAEQADVIIRQKSVPVRLYREDSSWFIRATFGSALRANGRLDEAVTALRSSIELIETRRALLADALTLTGYLRGRADPYWELLSLLAERGEVREAIAVGEKYRARALASAVARGKVERLPPMSQADASQYQALNVAIADANRKLLASSDDSANVALRERLAEHRVELRVLLTRIYAASREHRGRNLEDTDTILADARRLIPQEDEALLIFSVHGEETFAFFAERTGDDLDLDVHRIEIGKKDLEEHIRLFVRQIEDRNLDYRRSSRCLYDLLIAPFAPRLQSKRLLSVVPDGMLWRIPFQALQSPEGDYLVERVALAYAPSVTLLRHARGRRNVAPRTLLAIADPVLPPGSEVAVRAAARGSLTALPDARTEALEVVKMYDRESRALVGAEATEATAKKMAPSFPILHLATHGIIDDASPMYSAVVLGASGSEDGLLEAREMLELDLGADLAILSACESARGDVTPGEGMIGMAWALMVAGCRNTVVSQWKVDSASTSQLMIAFHSEIRRRDADYASALRQAQLTLLGKPELRHPYYWAPFVLITTSQ